MNVYELIAFFIGSLVIAFIFGLAAYFGASAKDDE
jgi:hypothetical protein